MNNSEINFEQIGKKIRAYRKGLGKTQRDLAENIGVTSTTIGNIENGVIQGGGSVEIYVKIAKTLNISLDELFNIKSENNNCEAADIRRFQIIKDFMNLCEPKVEVELCEKMMYSAKLLIADIGTAYYIQEYSKLISALKEISKIQYPARIDEMMKTDFDNRVTDKMSFSDNRHLWLKDGNYLLAVVATDLGEVYIEPHTLNFVDDNCDADSLNDSPTDEANTLQTAN